MPLAEADIDAVCKLVDELCGIYLDEKKGYLIESRLESLLKSSGCQSYSELVRKVRSSADRNLRNQIIDSITTNETLFFRDQSPFEALQHKVLPELIDSKTETAFPKRIRIWSAACSTGQEVYSIGMTLCELIADIHSWDIQILGTDISDAAVARSSRGWYAPHEIERGLSRERLTRFFRPEEGGWRVKDELRALAMFDKKNLLEPLGMTGRFDIVFCRNVVIYFTKEVRRDLIERITKTMTPAGYLFVGSQETLTDLGPRFVPQHHCRATLYQPNLQVATVAG